VPETTALGAAYLAGLAVGVWSGGEEIAAQWAVGQRFEPRLSESGRRARIARWREAVERSRGWAREMPASATTRLWRAGGLRR
jgi:glycerol kinase